MDLLFFPELTLGYTGLLQVFPPGRRTVQDACSSSILGPPEKLEGAISSQKHQWENHSSSHGEEVESGGDRDQASKGGSIPWAALWFVKHSGMY